MSNGSPVTARSVRSTKSRSSNLTATRPMPTDGRVIGLPSTTSTGLWAVRDEGDERPDAVVVAPSTDYGYLAVTEMETLRELNERLQRKIAALELAKGDAISAHASAEGQVISLDDELARERQAWGATENSLRREGAGLLQKLAAAQEVAAHAQAEEWPRRLGECEIALRAEKAEVQRAVAHARAAGRAADEANAALDAERVAASQRAAQVQSEAVGRAVARAVDPLQRELRDLREKVQELEEDVETEREWREAAQGERKQAEVRCEALQKHAEDTEALAHRSESQTGTLKQELEKLRSEAESAEASRGTAEASRKDAARKRVRDRNSDAFHAKEAERAKAKQRELEGEKLRVAAVEELPRVQQALKREKQANAKLQQQLEHVLGGGGKGREGNGARAEDGGPPPATPTSPRAMRNHSPVTVGSSTRNKGNGSDESPPPRLKPVERVVAEQKRTSPIALKRSSGVDRERSNSGASGKAGNAGSGVKSSKQTSTTAAAQQGVKPRKPIPKPSAASVPNAGLKRQQQQQQQQVVVASRRGSAAVNDGNNDDDDFDFDDDDDFDDLPPVAQRGVRRGAPVGLSDDFDSGGYGDEDGGEEKLLLSEARRGPRPPRQQVLAVRAAMEQQQKHQGPPIDASVLDGSDAPAWLRD